jgi:hypothetical protein
MAITFIVEDGTGVADANAYITLAFAREHHASRGKLATWDGTPVTTTITAANAGADTLTIADHPFQTGDGPVRLTGDDLPAGLAAATDYWLVAPSSSTVKVATSLANALAATTIDLTDAGSGAMTVVHPDFDAQRACIVRGTDHADTVYGVRFHGEKGSAEQGLFWPATGVYNDEGAIEGVPLLIKRGVAELALHVRAGDFDVSSAGAILSESKSKGGISRAVTYAAPVDAARRRYPAADRWFGPLLRPLYAERA